MSRSSVPLWSRSGDVPQRSVIGVYVSSGCRRVAAALVSAIGRGMECRPRVVAHLVEPLSDEISALYRQVADSRQMTPSTPAALAAMLAEAQASLVQRLAAANAEPSERALAIGIYDPGVWDVSTGRRTYASLCDAAQLAETTGYPVVDAFPARDVAQGGLGGPTLAMGQWLLARRPDRPAVLLDLGRTVKLTYLPPIDAAAWGRVMAFDVGPGTSLLDRLAEDLTFGEHTYDPGGKLAVQGRQIPDLVEHWLTDPYFRRPVPRWHPLGSRHEHELNQTVRMAVEAGWSVRDLLCTACHFIAEVTAQAIKQRLPQAPINEIILCGGGQQNGMLLRGLAARLPGWNRHRASDMELPDGAIDAAAAGLSALLHIDQAPSNPMGLTGATSPRVLGRLTPGSPARWQKLLAEMASHRPTMVSLRSAV